MIITYENQQDKVQIPKEAIGLLKKGLRAVGKLHKIAAKTEVDVTIVDDKTIHALNKQYRNIDRPTDVLSFALDEGEEDEASLKGAPEEHLLGDIIISAETCARQAELFGHGFNREFVYLAIHSCLHLLGYDHMEEAEKKEMRYFEEEALAKLKLSEKFLTEGRLEAQEAELHQPVQKEKALSTVENSVAVVGERQLSKKEKQSVEALKDRELTHKKEGKLAEAAEGILSEYLKKGNNKNKLAKPEKLIIKLYRAALKARENAYVPYSNFKVGAALITNKGEIFTGCNIENSSYGLTCCAERNAIFKAVTEGERDIIALLVVADTPEPVAPCGACRQVMAEFNIENIIMANCQGDVKGVSLSELLPYGFKL